MTSLLPCIEWADKLALKPTDLAPDERAGLHTHLAACPGCAATYADYQMLMTRLRALPRPALPPLEPLAPQLVDTYDAAEQPESAYNSIDTPLPTTPGTGSPRPPTRLPRLWRRSWLQRLSAIAAVLLVAVLVGSVVLLLMRHSQPGSFKLRPGWTVIAEYSGTGSKTLTGLDITLPYLWGSSFACSGSGRASAPATGPHFIGGFGGGDCTSQPTTILSPQDISLFNLEIQPVKIDTIKITANSDTHWHAQVVQAVPQPAGLGSEWTYSRLGVGGRNGGYLINTDFPLNGQQAELKTWGILFACVGTGTGYFQFDPDVGKLYVPPCDGRVKLIKASYPSPTKIGKFIKGYFTGDISLSLLPVGCVNEQKCAQD